MNIMRKKILLLFLIGTFVSCGGEKKQEVGKTLNDSTSKKENLIVTNGDSPKTNIITNFSDSFSNIPGIEKFNFDVALTSFAEHNTELASMEIHITNNLKLSVKDLDLLEDELNLDPDHFILVISLDNIDSPGKKITSGEYVVNNIDKRSRLMRMKSEFKFFAEKNNMATYPLFLLSGKTIITSFTDNEICGTFEFTSDAGTVQGSFKAPYINSEY